MGQHGQLGAARGAGGGGDEGRVVGRDGLDPGLELDGPVAAQGADLVEGFEAGHVVGHESLGVVEDDVLQQGQGIADGQDLVDLLLGLGHHEPGLGEFEDVADLLAGRVLVQAQGHPAQALDGQLGPEPLGAVVADDDDDVAAAKAQGLEAGRELGGDVPVLFVGEWLPDAEALLAQGRAAGALAAVVEEQAGERGFVWRGH